MNIVHINATDARGGAAIACTRHSEAMNTVGLDSKIIVANNFRGINRILKSCYFRINSKREAKLNATANFSLMDFGMPLYKNPVVKNADIVFLHWICANTLSINGVEKILQLGKPTFWYMHDMFPFTGGCHYALSCTGYIHQCLNCPQISNDAYREKAAKQLVRKIDHWRHYLNLEFVAPSSWEAECAKKSALCKGHKIHVVPNILNTDIYKPIYNNNEAKAFFGLNPQKKTVLFSATRIGSPYKGAKYARECLKMLDSDRYEGLVMGRADMDFISDLPIRVVQTGFLSDDYLIAKAYNACDTFLMTSIAESFGQVVLEAMACGKPCIGFPTGGVLDLILHKKTGYLTRDYNPLELKEGIEWLFSDGERYKCISSFARDQILRNNSYDKVLNIHSELKPYINERIN